MPRPEGDKGGLLSNRMEGHWRRPGDASCADGPVISLQGPDIIVTFAGGQRIVHQIDSDAALRTETHVVDPPGGPHYVFLPEFNATSELRSFNLILENTATGQKENWTPCELD